MTGGGAGGFDVRAAVDSRELRFLHDEDAGRWLVAISDAGDPQSWTVEVDVGQGFEPESFEVDPPGFPAIVYARPRGAWFMPGGPASVRVTTPDGQVVELGYHL